MRLVAGKDTPASGSMTGLRPGVIRAIVVGVAVLAATLPLFPLSVVALGCGLTENVEPSDLCSLGRAAGTLIFAAPLAVLALGTGWSLRTARLTPVFFAAPLSWVALLVALACLS